MATSAVTPQKAAGITLKTVIAELQFIQELAADNPRDPRIAKLLDDAQNDLAVAAAKIPIAYDPGIVK